MNVVCLLMIFADCLAVFEIVVMSEVIFPTGLAAFTGTESSEIVSTQDGNDMLDIFFYREAQERERRRFLLRATTRTRIRLRSH